MFFHAFGIDVITWHECRKDINARLANELTNVENFVQRSMSRSTLFSGHHSVPLSSKSDS